jgi:hypothetical protein
MGTLTRLHDFETDRDAVPPVLISATKIDAELDQVVTESNAQDVRLDTLETGGNVSTADLADDCVTPAKTSFVDDTLVATDTHIMVADGTDFDNVAVSGDATLSNAGVLTVGTGAITSAKILDGTIATADIADGAITAAKIADGTVVTAEIADDAVTTAKILDSNVTAGKLASNSVTTIKITDANVTTAKIADANVTSAKLATNIDAIKIHDGTVSNTEFGYLNGVTSNIQTQITNIVAGTVEDVKDNVFTICDDLDSTKDIAFQASGITSGNTRTITMADQDIDLTPDTGTYQSAGSGVSAGFAIAMSIAL